MVYISFLYRNRNSNFGIIPCTWVLGSLGFKWLRNGGSTFLGFGFEFDYNAECRVSRRILLRIRTREQVFASGLCLIAALSSALSRRHLQEYDEP